MVDKRPIGIFDSGIGGLTVLKAIMELLPGERIVYFGDCARAPYGIKSRDTIERYVFQIARFFIEKGVKMLVIACNTASAFTYKKMSDALDIPVIDVIIPGAKAVSRVTRNGRVGVICTQATVESGAYEAAIKSQDAGIKVFTKACPLFVPLVEEDVIWWSHDATRIIAAEYMSAFRGIGIDSLVLGCTHYPLIKEVIRTAVTDAVVGDIKVGDEVKLVSSAQTVAEEVRRVLAPASYTSKPGEVDFYTSDEVARFEKLCGNIIGKPVASGVYKLDIEKYESRPL